MHLDGAPGQRLQAEAEFGQGQQHERGTAHQQEHRLGDLHPGGGQHAAEDHVDQHQHADHHHRDRVVQAEQQLDQLAGADHLQQQVAADHGERAAGRQHPDPALVEAEGDDVGEGVAAQVAQALGHQEGEHRPADEEAGDVDETVVALGEHQAGKPQQGGGRHVVAGDRQAVLQAADAAAGGIEVVGRLGTPRRPPGDQQGRHHEHQEHGDGMQVDGLRGAGAGAGQGGQGGQAGGDGTGGCAVHAWVSLTICSLRLS
ncbi:hypothetical protein D9M69_300350 [compost metagenome]